MEVKLKTIETSVEQSGIKTIEIKEKQSEGFRLNFQEKTSPSSDNNYRVEIEREEIEKKSKERIQKLKDLSLKLRTPSEIEELESVPAYVRRNVELNDVSHSADTIVSKYTLGDSADNGLEIKSNNSFLHDNVD